MHAERAQEAEDAADHPAEERVGEDPVGKGVLLAFVARPETTRAIEPVRRVTRERAARFGAYPVTAMARRTVS